MPLSTREGWCNYVQAAPPARPDRVTPEALSELPPGQRRAYDYARADWHANLTPVRTPALQAVHEGLDDLTQSNRQRAGTVRPALAVDGYPGLGKTTALKTYGRIYQRAEIDRLGATTSQEQDRLPVCFATLTSRTTLRSLNAALCEFYGASVRGAAHELGRRLLDEILAHDTSLIMIDDLHFLDGRQRAGREVSDHLKHLQSVLPVSFAFAGIDLTTTGLLDDGGGRHRTSRSQTARRWTMLPVEAFTDPTDSKGPWRRLLRALERDLVLSRHAPGTLDDLSEWMYGRTQGVLASLTQLLVAGCTKAIRNGHEALDEELLSGVRLDYGAETAT